MSSEQPSMFPLSVPECKGYPSPLTEQFLQWHRQLWGGQGYKTVLSASCSESAGPWSWAPLLKSSPPRAGVVWPLHFLCTPGLRASVQVCWHSATTFAVNNKTWLLIQESWVFCQHPWNCGGKLVYLTSKTKISTASHFLTTMCMKTCNGLGQNSRGE